MMAAPVYLAHTTHRWYSVNKYCSKGLGLGWGFHQKLTYQDEQYFNAIFESLKWMQKFHDEQYKKILNKDRIS